jgi:hypothetical protein
VRDRDCVYGEAYVQRLRAMGIRDRPTALRSPWENAYAERLVGSIRRDCLDHIIVLGDAHLRAVPKHLIQACPYRKLCPAVLMVADVGFEDTARHLLYNVDDKRSRISHAACSTIS